MNYLELCQQLVSRAGISGVIVSVVGNTGEAQRVVNWVAEAYLAIQNKHTDWEFKRRDVTFPTMENIAAYTAGSAGVQDFGDWRLADDWRCYATASGFADEQPVRVCAYDHFRQVYGYGMNRMARGRPQVVAEKPDQSLAFWPTPDAPYTIIGEQYRGPHLLAANADVPMFPAKYHMGIVYRALMLYAEFEGDPSVFGAAQLEFGQVLAQMERDYMPEWEPASPMA